MQRLAFIIQRTVSRLTSPSDRRHRREIYAIAQRWRNDRAKNSEAALRDLAGTNRSQFGSVELEVHSDPNHVDVGKLPRLGNAPSGGAL